ncbi:MFS family permease [Thermocatellispora tengchongensis]|uniref:MFS family permease n=1 Tax=Thermocatellispora tengchongensis TaxID=1073253 RepID=A0A840P6A4_9ACTN|nr:MFS transporter [Thermocatellispora tengchongensis]MBB5131535.1 MFS family permease [Thermocatellispora tengchongensis]
MPVPAAAEARTGFGARLLAPLYLSVTLNPVNSAILATALTDIGASLGVGLAAASTLVAALYLVSAVAQPFLGRLAERYGARRVLLAGHLLVLAGAAVAMAAPSLPWLLAARCLIGAGTSAAYPCAMAIVRARADERGGEVPRGVLGGLAMCNQLAVALGLAFGGVLVGAGGWRWTFAVNLPLAALAIVTTLLYVPATRGGPVRGRTALGALDPLGVLLFTVAVTSGFLVLHAFPAPSPYALAVCAASSVALVAWELRAAAPFVDVRALAATPALLWTHLRNALTYVTVYSVLYGFGAWLGSRGGYPPGTAGLLLLPISLGGAAASALAGRMRAPRLPLVLCGAATTAGAALLALVSPGGGVALPLAVAALFGLAMGLGAVGNQQTLYQQSPPAETASSAGLLRTSMYLGATVSSALIAVVLGPAPTGASLRDLALIMLVLGAALTALPFADRHLRPGPR